MLRPPSSSRFVVSATAVLVTILMAATAQAQIARDATPSQIGTPGPLTSVGGVFEIDGVDGIRAGTNNEIVIHSMSEFNLGASETARYLDSNAALLNSVTNVLTRVTGGNASMLDGRIESLYPNADLFFVNPNGVFFGANFTIDVPKSFHSSTADLLEWDAGVDIETGTPTDIPMLTAAVPMAWRFLSAGPEKRIDVDGFTVADSFNIGESEAFTFVGSELAFGDAATPIDINTNGRNFLAVALGDSGSAEGLFDFVSPLFGGIIISPANGVVAGNIDLNGQVGTAGSGPRNGDIAFWANDLAITGSLVTASTQMQGQNSGFIRTTTQGLSVDGLLDTSSVTGDGRDITIVATDRIDFASGSILRTGAVADGMNSGHIRILGAGSRLTGTNVLFESGTNALLGVGGMTITADIIDLQGVEFRASAGTGSANTIGITGRQILLSGIGPNTIDVSGDSSDAGSFIIRASEFIDFRNVSINASGSGGGDGGVVGFLGTPQVTPQVTSDANFFLDLTAAAGGFPGDFLGTAPTITANPPAVDPDPNAVGIFRDSTPGQQEGPLTPIANIYEINGNDGLRRDNDEVVIHSFEQFDLESFETARFTDDPFFLGTVTDVFTRVTGSQSSQLNGLFENLYTNASLTFVNSNGVIFGDGFTLDTNGTFYASTADSISFDNGLTVDLTSPLPVPVFDGLTAIRWNFLNIGPEIVVNGFDVVENDQLEPGHAIGFFGSNVTFDMLGPLQTKGRDLLAVAVGSSGGIDLIPIPDRAALGTVPDGALTLDLLADNVNNTTGTDNGDFGGDIVLLGANVEVTLGSGSTLSTGAGTTIGPNQVQDAGDVFVIARDFRMSGQGPAILTTTSRGLVGSTVIDASSAISFLDTQISSRALSADQNAGDVSLSAGGVLSGFLSVFANASGARGDGGTVDLSADQINLTDLRIGTSASTGGIPGAISITGRQLSLNGQDEQGLVSIFAAAIDSRESGGNILIDASEVLDIRQMTINASNIGFSVGGGDGGFVEINAPFAGTDVLFTVDVSSDVGSPGTLTGTAYRKSRIIRDATAGQVAGTIVSTGDVHEITGIAGIRRGPGDSIVVHSFDQFDLMDFETARFTDAPGFLTSVRSVLTRVTGGLSSQLDGTIETLYANADLFFVNPSGIVFGPGFTFDTSSAFYASTADSLEWDPGVSIDFTTPTAGIPILTGITPQRWEFLGGGPTKSIVIDGFNIVDTGPLAPGGDFLSFVGSELSLNTDLISQGRSVEFLSVGSAGGVDFDLTAVPTVAPDGTITIAGDIRTASSNGSVGDILLLGGQVNVSGALDTSETGQGTSIVSEEIAIVANRLVHSGFTNTQATGQSGDIFIQTFDSASFTSSELVSSVLGDDGIAGNITVSATNSLTSDVFFTVVAEAFGVDSTAGTINLSADVVDLQNMSIGAGAFVDAQAGTIQISGRDLTLIGAGADSISVSSVGATVAGSVLIDATENLDFQNLTINASNSGLLGGDGGFVEVNAATGIADALFDVDVSSATGADGTVTGTFFAPPPPAPDQIVRDSTPGQTNPGVGITPVGDVYVIDGNDGIRRGTNGSIVLHSFSQFDLDSFETARYTDDAGFLASVQNVITRVTGGLASQLDGAIESLYANADLFFVNPNGVFFGDGFTIDVPRSFHVSTADTLEWDAGVEINMGVADAVPDLISVTPLAWGFASGGPEKRITIDGFEAVDTGDASGEEFTFVGSELVSGTALDFTQISTNGRHFVGAALGGAGTVAGFAGVDNPAANLELLLTPDAGFSLGRIDRFGGLDVRGSGVTNGDILLWGGDIAFQGNITSQGNGGLQNGGDISVIATDGLAFNGSVSVGGRSGGDGGDINFTSFGAMSLEGFLATANTGTGGGAAGNVALTATTTLTGTDLTILADGDFALDSDAGGIGLVSDVINFNEFRLDASADGTGDGGGIIINARDVSLVTTQFNPIDVSASGSGNAGVISFNVAETLDLQGVTFNASNTGTGDGGSIFVTDNTPTLTFTADAAFSFDVSAADPGATDGMYFGLMPNGVTPPPAPDQIVRDTTPGQTPGGITPVGDVYEINGNDGIRRDNDSIVVHSLERFDLESFETARYTDDPGFLASVTNVITRITGGLSSQLDGAIESLYANADLFFVNASGVIFGESFTINVPQSFHVSTADTLEWDVAASINTSIPDDIPALTGTTPLAWGFTSGGPTKRITIDGFEAVDSGDVSGEEFTFVGSEIVSGTPLVFSQMSTNGRHFIGAALDGEGTVAGFAGAQNPADSLELLVSPTGGSSLGRIDFYTGLDVRGEGMTNGDMLFWGGDVSLQGGYTSQSGVAGLRNGGDATVIATDTLSVDGDISIGGTNGGQGGNLILASLGSMNLEGFLATGNNGTAAGGAAGNISLTAATTLTGTNLTISASEDFVLDSDAGAISIQADVIDLNEFRLAASARTNPNTIGTGSGNGGGISIIGRDVSLITTRFKPIDVSASGSGDSGGIVFNVTENIDFQGVTLNAANTGTGDGGIIVVTDSAPLIFTADTAFAFDVSAADANATDGMFIGRMPDTGTTPTSTPPPETPPTDERSDVVASLDQFVSFSADDTPPPVAADATFEFAATEPNESDTQAGDENELADGSADSAGDGTIPEVSAGVPSSAQGDDGAGSETLLGFDENEPEAAVAATTADSSEDEATVPGIALYTRAGERAPLMPRTCDVLAKTNSGSRLLARNPRRRPISSEDWLLTFDKTGDQLIALASDTVPPVGSDRRADRNPSNRLGEIQRAFSEAAVAIRGDRYDEAADRFMTAVDALEETGNTSGATQALLAFAQLQFEDGRFASARESLDRALGLAEKDGDEANIAAVRQHLANALIGVGDLAGAEEELTRGLSFVLESEDKGQGPSMLNDLGNRHAAKRDYKSALWAYERAAKLAKELDRVGDEARALAGAARVAVDVSRLDDAWRFVERADRLRNMIRDTRARTAVAIHIGHTFSELASVTSDRRSDAILKASAAFESALRDAKAMGDDYSLALANLNLGALYQDEQHRSEALYLTRLARRSATKVDAAELIYRAHWQEGQILWSSHRVRDALASHRRAIEILEETKPVASAGYGASDASFQQSVGGVYRDLVDLLLRSSELATSRVVSNQLIVEARETLEKLKGAELRDYFEDECIASVREGGRSIKKGVAVVHTVILPDRLELLVTLPTGVERFSSRISASKLIALVDEFRSEVQNPRSDAYRPLSRQLFELVVAPYSSRLQESGVETLIFVPDGRLRTLPFVALHDGEVFLADRYATATTLSLNLLSNPDLATEIGAPVLAGISESVQGFVALEAVDDELEEIQAIEGGELLLNQAFTLARIESAVAQQAPSILHLATHAVFTGNPDTSFLLTYDGRIGFDELSDVVGMKRAEAAPLDLLVLSACETAIGNDRAGLGFTGSAIRAGARSAVGSLWPIADEAARQLMVDFYKNLKSSEQTKADALQQAQASLRGQDRYSHPAYWAPFTLVNDWL